MCAPSPPPQVFCLFELTHSILTSFCSSKNTQAITKEIEQLGSQILIDAKKYKADVTSEPAETSEHVKSSGPAQEHEQSAMSSEHEQFAISSVAGIRTDDESSTPPSVNSQTSPAINSLKNAKEINDESNKVEVAFDDDVAKSSIEFDGSSSAGGLTISDKSENHAKFLDTTSLGNDVRQ
jgi:hypothetical protein